MHLREGTLRHPKVEVKTFDQASGKVLSSVSCKKAAKKPSGKSTLWGSFSLHSSSKYVEMIR
jgi:hypothetical protein